MPLTSKICDAASQASARNQSGATLLESLVALLILAVGVLGLLGAQLRTLTENQTANNRQIAVRLADDLLERLKANPGRWTAVAQYTIGWGNPPSFNPSPDCSTAECTGAQKATWDIAKWKESIRDTLPAGQATAFVSPTDTRQLGVMIAWRANERVTDADYVAPLNVNVSDGGTDIQCPASRICHITYGQP